MSSRVISGETDVRCIFDDLRSRIQIERRCVGDELESFRTFRTRVEGISPSKPIRVATVRRSVQQQRTPGLDRVRDEYESTVMSVPHYDEEYDDSYEESVTEEFGPEIGFLLTEGPSIDRRLRRALLDRTRQWQSERESLLRTLDLESESVDEIRDRLLPIVDELQNFTAEGSQHESDGVREAEWERLGVLSGTVNGIATDRQESIIRQRKEFNITVEAPDIPTYLYREFPERYPLLSLIVAVEEEIQSRRTDREKVLS
jgi:hypothetical protein